MFKVTVRQYFCIVIIVEQVNWLFKSALMKYKAHEVHIKCSYSQWPKQVLTCVRTFRKVNKSNTRHRCLIVNVLSGDFKMSQCQTGNHWYYTHVLLHHDHLLYPTYKQKGKTVLRLINPHMSEYPKLYYVLLVIEPPTTNIINKIWLILTLLSFCFIIFSLYCIVCDTVLFWRGLYVLFVD